MTLLGTAKVFPIVNIYFTHTPFSTWQRNHKNKLECTLCVCVDMCHRTIQRKNMTKENFVFSSFVHSHLKHFLSNSIGIVIPISMLILELCSCFDFVFIQQTSSSTKTTTMTTPAKLFGKNLGAYDEVDVDELLAQLSAEEIKILAKEVDPDVSCSLSLSQLKMNVHFVPFKKFSTLLFLVCRTTFCHRINETIMIVKKSQPAHWIEKS